MLPNDTKTRKWIKNLISLVLRPSTVHNNWSDVLQTKSWYLQELEDGGQIASKLLHVHVIPGYLLLRKMKNEEILISVMIISGVLFLLNY